MLTASVEQKIKQILNVFETGKATPQYDAVFVYPDGLKGRRQVTLSFGFTEDGSNLGKLLTTYSALNGSYASQFAPFLPKLGTGVLATSNTFKELLKETAQKDAFFCECQDFCFNALYLRKGIERAAEFGIKTNLGIAIICDSVLHGSLETVSRLFVAARPSRGGDEKTWCIEYVKARKQWLISKGKPLSDCVYRMNAFEDAIKKDNWDLSQLFNANGTVI